jgi:hypothetical protein
VPIYEDKDGNEEGQLVRQVHPLEALIVLLVYADFILTVFSYESNRISRRDARPATMAK